MPEENMPTPTNAELSILRVLWRRGASTVREVHEELNAESNTVQETGYTTVLKFMQIMHKKGLVERDSSEKAHVYEAAIEEAEAEQGIVKDVLKDSFQGSAKKLVLSALSMKTSTPEELAEIRKLIDKLENEQ